MDRVFNGINKIFTKDQLIKIILMMLLSKVLFYFGWFIVPIAFVGIMVLDIIKYGISNINRMDWISYTIGVLLFSIMRL